MKSAADLQLGFTTVSLVLSVLSRGIRVVADETGKPFEEVAATAVKELVCRVSDCNALECSILSELTVERIDRTIACLERVKRALKEL